MRRLSVSRLLALLSVALMLLPGCSCAPSVYIPMFPTMGCVEVVRITAFEYTPPGPIHVGDTLTFYVTLEKRSSNYYAPGWVQIGSAERPLAGGDRTIVVQRPYNDGENGDLEAGDHVWTWRYTWPGDLAPQTDIPVAAYNSLGRIEGEPLTVLPREED